MAEFKDIDILSTPLAGIDRLSRHLSYHAKRQELIAANLANIDTPGYRSKDLVFHEQLSMELNDGEMTHSMSHREEVITKDDEAPDQDGNSVSLEHQIARTTANTLRYEAINQILNRKLSMLRYAASDGRK